MTSGDQYASGMLGALRLGAVPVPGVLLRCYARMGLSEIEAMLIIHLMYFTQHEHVFFPTPEQLAERMSTPPDRVLAAIERLVRDRVIAIEDDMDPATGVRSERYNLMPLYERLAVVWASEPDFAAASEDYWQAEEQIASASAQVPTPGAEYASGRETSAARRRDLFTVFENEFGRALSPLEYETIVGWLDQDQYSDALIMAALKEAVFAGKVHFRYIDRILLEWKRNGITTPEEAKAYTERFRGDR